MAIEGTVVHGMIVLDGNETLPDGVRVEVVVKTPVEPGPTLSERLLRHAGTVPGLPADNPSTGEWTQGALDSGSFDFWLDASEDLYTEADGEPL